VLLAVTLVACHREERRARDVVMPEPTATSASDNPYENNAWALAEGQTLYQWFNCIGCHAQGGGGMGPALMDDAWLYGSRPADVFASIADGRPNGMPAFRQRLSTQQLWQLVTYVRAMSGHARLDVPPSRTDHMQARPSMLAMPEPSSP
jgi:cytochrome c oxidase cbb3-type subunit 3